MKHLRLFKTEAEHTLFKESEEFILPNVSYVVELDSVNFNPYIPPPPVAGDIVYYTNGSLKTVKYIDWKTDLGTPVGVIVVPEGFVPDGKARMVSLKFATSDGTSSDSAVGLTWGSKDTDTTLTNYDRLPLTDNDGNTITGGYSYGYLPSDNFSGKVSVIDPEAKYCS